MHTPVTPSVKYYRRDSVLRERLVFCFWLFVWFLVGLSLCKISCHVQYNLLSCTKVECCCEALVIDFDCYIPPISCGIYIYSNGNPVEYGFCAESSNVVGTFDSMTSHDTTMCKPQWILGSASLSVAHRRDIPTTARLVVSTLSRHNVNVSTDTLRALFKCTYSESLSQMIVQ